MQVENDTKVKTEWISCNACGADEFQEVCLVDGWHVGRCGKCSLVYVNPMPFFKPDDFGGVTEQFYYTQWQQEITEEKTRLAEREFGLQLAEIRRLTGSQLTTGRFLDVGCGPGLGVRAAVDMGWQGIGVDIDPGLVNLGRDKLGVDLLCTDLLASELEEGSFDFIKIKFVLEHLPNPKEALDMAKRLLRPGGLILIIVPNEDGLFNRIRLLRGKDQDRLGTLIAPHHLHAYGHANMARLLEAAGLEARMIGSVSPRDPAYGTFDQFEDTSALKKLLDVVWMGARAIGMGSVLIAYAGKGENE